MPDKSYATRAAAGPYFAIVPLYRRERAWRSAAWVFPPPACPSGHTQAMTGSGRMRTFDDVRFMSVFPPDRDQIADVSAVWIRAKTGQPLTLSRGPRTAPFRCC